MTITDDEFQLWLAHIDDALAGFVAHFPEGKRAALDYSLESLDVVEAWLLDRYDGIDAVKPSSEAAALDGAARYVGETFRQHLGGKWVLQGDAGYAFYGLPELVGFEFDLPRVCPRSFVTAALDRRRGDFIRQALAKRIARRQAGT